MKYDLPLLDFDTRFSLWQVKMWAVLAHHDLDDALEGFGEKDGHLMKRGKIVRLCP
jgi:hypothetical protein